MDSIEQKVDSFIARHKLLHQGQKVLVALSGGADSVCLLLIMKALGYDCHAAHCNFHLRGEESMRDEQFVTELCAQQNITLHKTHFNTVSYAKQHGVSIEMAARNLRYDYFESLIHEYLIPTIATGHHKDDKVETALLNMVRGTGIRGITSLKPQRKITNSQSLLSNSDFSFSNTRHSSFNIIHPLLSITHNEIITYLTERGQIWVEDSTNQNDDVARNIIRLNVLPQLERINPSAAHNIITTIENLQEVERIYFSAISLYIEECLDAEGVMNIHRLLSTVSPQSVLHEWLEGRGFNRGQEQDILQSATSGQSGKIYETSVERLLVDRDTLILESEQQFIKPSDIIIQRLPSKEVNILPDSNHAYLDAAKIKGELTIREAKSSDTFQPFGMKGRKLLSDFMTDRKLNLFQKRHQLVVSDSSDIVWLVGLRASECYRVDNSTTEVIVLSLVN